MNTKRSNEEYIMVAYLLGWSGDWWRMKKALDQRYKRLKARQARNYNREYSIPQAA
jgi:hypothetical protein